jgi:GxxExxY protein
MNEKLVNFDLTEKILGCAITVHKALGPGLLEKFYEEALCIELAREKLSFERQVAIALKYCGRLIGYHRIDLVVDKTVIVELKAIKKLEDIHYAVTLSYLKASRIPVALLLNFNSVTLQIRRFAYTIFNLNAETQKEGKVENIVEFLRSQQEFEKENHNFNHTKRQTIKTTEA